MQLKEMGEGMRMKEENGINAKVFFKVFFAVLDNGH